MKTSTTAFRIDGRVFGLKVAACAAIIAFGVWAGGHHGWVWTTVSVIVIGAMFAHAVELQHQALHNTGFRSKCANRIVGTLLGVPMLISFTDYQTSHLRHHRTLGTPADRESFDYDYASLRHPLRLIFHLLMIRHYLLKFKTLATAVRPAKARDPRLPQIRNEYRLMMGVLAGGLLLSIAFGSTAFLFWWLLPLFAVAAPLHVLIELPEHIGCNPAARDIFANTRTIRTSSLMSWFVNGNNFHVEHHWRAGVQVEDWAKLHEILQAEIEYLEPSYRSFYWRFFTALRRGFIHDPAYWATGKRASKQPGVVSLGRRTPPLQRRAGADLG